MKDKSLVSIIMNWYNGEKYLDESIQSIINQKYKNWELIFWDNKSTDNSAKIFKSFKDSRLKYFFSDKKTVLYKARNLAIKKAKGEFIAFLDVDDIWSKDKLSKQIPKFTNKKVGLVYSNFYKYFQRNKKKEIAYKNNLPAGYIAKQIIEKYQVGFLTVVLRKKFLIKEKVFDFEYDLIADYDFILNFSKKHYFECINQPLAFYRIHSNQLQKIEMINQAKQYCRWIKNKNILKKFREYNLNSIKKKYDYFQLIKDLDKNKLKIFWKIFKKQDYSNFIKITALVFFPNKIIYDFIENV